MEEVKDELIDSQTDPAIDDTDDLFDDGVEGVDEVEDLKRKNAQLFARAKKAEGFVFENGQWVKPAPVKKPEVKEIKTDNNLSQTDIIAIIKADVNEDDISDVVDYSKLKGISVMEALKTSVVKTILAEKEEERRTANATATGNIRKSASKPNATQMLNNAMEKGELPESVDDMRAMIRARMGK